MSYTIDEIIDDAHIETLLGHANFSLDQGLHCAVEAPYAPDAATIARFIAEPHRRCWVARDETGEIVASIFADRQGHIAWLFVSYPDPKVQAEAIAGHVFDTTGVRLKGTVRRPALLAMIAGGPIHVEGEYLEWRPEDQ